MEDAAVNKQAKIGIVVVLVVVVALVIIWGLGGGSSDSDKVADTGHRVASTPPDTGGSRLSGGTEGGVSVTSPTGAFGNLPIPSGLTLPTPSTPTTGTSALAPVTPVTPTVVAPRPAAQAWDYAVASNDRGLQQIAREKLGDSKRWKEIAQLNNLKSPYLIRVGQKLKMPAKEMAAATTGVAAPAAGATTPAVGATTMTTGTLPTIGEMLPAAGTMPAVVVGITPTTGAVAPTVAGITPTAGTATAAPVVHRKYKVSHDDLCLTQIAREQLGDSKRWKTIASLNNLGAPYTIHVGQVLLLPQ